MEAAIGPEAVDGAVVDGSNDALVMLERVSIAGNAVNGSKK